MENITLQIDLSPSHFSVTDEADASGSLLEDPPILKQPHNHVHGLPVSLVQIKYLKNSDKQK